jgi:plastocyanin
VRIKTLMPRLAGITTLYALVAALVLVAPLSASQEPVPSDPASPEAVSPDTAPPEAAPPAAEPAPADEAPADAGAPPAEPPPAETPAAVAEQPAPAPAAEPAPAEVAPAPADSTPAEGAPPKRERERTGRRPRAKAAASASVTIRDFEFAPASVTIDAGDTVTWNNQGPTGHSATADNGSFDTGILDDGQSGSHTFDQAGTFSYFCTPHPNMRGTITVRAASAGGSGDDTAGDGAAGDGAAGSEPDSGPTLAVTGLDAGGLAILGVVTLALGAWLRRRAAPAG